MAVDLSGLRDIHLPIEPSWWPPALGWWLLLMGGLVLVGICCLVFWHWYNQPKQYALRELKSLVRQASGPVDLARRISLLLKRVALTVYPRRKVAALTGDRWIEFLCAHTGSTFSDAQLHLLGFAAYMPDQVLSSDDAGDLYQPTVRAIIHLFKEKKNVHKHRKSK